MPFYFRILILIFFIFAISCCSNNIINVKNIRTQEKYTLSGYFVYILGQWYFFPCKFGDNILDRVNYSFIPDNRSRVFGVSCLPYSEIGDTSILFLSNNSYDQNCFFETKIVHFYAEGMFKFYNEDSLGILHSEPKNPCKLTILNHY